MRRGLALVAMDASAEGLEGLHMSDHVEPTSSSYCLTLQVCRAHLRRLLLLLLRCHLVHLSVVDEPHVLACGIDVARRLGPVDLEVQTSRARLLGRPLQALKLLLGHGLGCALIAASIQGVEVVNGAPRRRAQNIRRRLAISLLAKRFRLHFALIC